MELLTTIAWTAFFTVGFLLIYKFVINPQVILSLDTSKMAKCPDGWAYNIATSTCDPQVKSTCYPFDPDAIAIQSAAAKCNLARTCGTTWSGMCA
jgi:hypothetical protein